MIWQRIYGKWFPQPQPMSLEFGGLLQWHIYVDVWNPKVKVMLQFAIHQYPWHIPSFKVGGRKILEDERRASPIRSPNPSGFHDMFPCILVPAPTQEGYPRTVGQVILGVVVETTKSPSEEVGAWELPNGRKTTDVYIPLKKWMELDDMKKCPKLC